MGDSVNPGYRYCARVECNVSLEQTEGQCRSRHNCSDDACPLEPQFVQAKFPSACALLAPFIRGGDGPK
jgi:hypothetical protein